MSTQRRRIRLTRRSAAKALDHGGHSGMPALDQVLSAASAPATGSELGQESDAVAMFRTAHPGPVQRAGKPNMVKTTLSKLTTAKLILAGASALTLAIGGVAFAASTGHLPNPLGSSHQSPTGVPQAHSPHATPTDEATDDEGTETPGTPSPGTPSTTASASATASARLTGLCHAFQASATANGKALSNPGFTALSNAAGGADNIATYCVALIGTPSAHPTTDVTHPVKPTRAATPTRRAHPVKPTRAARPEHPANNGVSQPDSLPTQANSQPTD